MKRFLLFLLTLSLITATSQASPIFDGINIRLDNYGGLYWPNGDAFLYSYNTGTDRKTVWGGARNMTIAPGGENWNYACLQLGNTDAVNDYVRIQRNGYPNSTNRRAVPSKQWLLSTVSYLGDWTNNEVGFQGVTDEWGNVSFRFFTQAKYGPDGWMTGNLILELAKEGAEIMGARISSGSVPPNGIIIGNVGDIYTNKNGLPGSVFWIKEVGNETYYGWTAK